MSALPHYLGALARAGHWLLPAGEAEDAAEVARPRPRGRFEPDRWGGDDGWREVTEEHELDEAPPAARDVPVSPVPPPPPPVVPLSGGAPLRTEPTGPPPAPALPDEAAPPEPGLEVGPAPAPEVEAVRADVAEHRTPQPVPRPHLQVVAEPGDPLAARPRPGPVQPGVPAAAAPLAQPDAEPDPHVVTVVPGPVRDRVVHEARPAPTAPLLPVPPPDLEPASGRDPDEGPTILVEIGRIEVRLSPDPVPAPRPAVRAAPGPSLAEYLQQRDPAGVTVA